MMLCGLLVIFSLFAGSPAFPILRRQGPEPFVLPVPREGPGPTFDATATRAATGVQIRNAANPDICFDVSDFRAGDFRFNLVPLALRPCDGTIDGQKFDLITKGEHNNVADGTRTLIVSSQQFTCVDRRGNKNDRNRPGLFACGGRAVGDGETTSDQQYFFNKTASLGSGIGFTNVRDAVNNGVGPGNTCITFNRDGFVSNAPCAPPNFTPEQTWVIGETNVEAPVPQPAPSSSASAATTPASSVSSAPSAVTTPVPSTSSAPTPSSVSSTATIPSSTVNPPEKFVLPVPAEGPGPTFDETATRAATSVHIRNPDTNLCFDVSHFRAGDFRFNLVPIALKPCDSAIDGQKFDLITKGAHNNVQDGSRTLIVSSQQFTCVDRRSNRNDRNRPGLFACGGRAAGDGETTADQQFFFNGSAQLSDGIGFPLVRDSVNNGAGPGNQCLTLNRDGFLSNAPCNPSQLAPEQVWVVGDLSGDVPSLPNQPTPSASTSPGLGEPSECPIQAPAVVTVTVTVAEPSATQAPAPSSITVAPESTNAGARQPSATNAPSTEQPEEFVLPVPQEGPGPLLDTTATRAATSVQIRSAAQPDICFDVSDFRAGDFRFNLVPLALGKCDASIAGQKFDLITKGKHNNVQDESRVIIVSAQQLTCVDRRGNKNDRNRPGLFACGGRAVGDGETSFDQQFFFDKTADLSKGIAFPTVRDASNNGVGQGNQCLTLNPDGFLSNAPCSPPNLTPEQTWIIG